MSDDAQRFLRLRGGRLAHWVAPDYLAEPVHEQARLGRLGLAPAHDEIGVGAGHLDLKKPAQRAGPEPARNEARRAEESGLLDQYLRAITDAIQRKWNQPLSARPGLECVINVTQIPSGHVTAVSFGRCNGDDAVKRSIEAAVQAASPLPRPPVPALFNRSLEVTFKPEV